MGLNMRLDRARGNDHGGRAPDVVVVGAGIIGSIVALRLAQRGGSVTMVDRGVLGGEASTAAAGILGPQLEASGPGPLLDLALASRALYPKLAAELRGKTGIDVGFERCGALAVALDERGEVNLDERIGWQVARRLAVRRLSGDEARAVEPALGAAVRAALEFPDEARVDARALTRACVEAATDAGVRFLDGRRVRRVIVERGSAVGVDVEGERLAAGTVVIAAGSWSGLLEGADLPPLVVTPVRGQVVSLAAPPSLLQRIVAVHGRGYLVPRHDGTVLAGSTMEHVGFDKAVTVAGIARILSLATALTAWLADAPIAGSWSGFRPDTEDHLPLLGETASTRRLVFATGHFRNGILLAPITGQAIAELIASGRSSVDLTPFSIDRFAPAASAARATSPA
jgi:glycine oxidase